MLNGSLKLSLLECGCNVNDISIKLDGGASWLYQGLIDAFEGKIGSAVENAVSKKIRDAIIKLDLQLQSLPKEAPITNFAELNVTFVDDPELSESSLDLEVDGLFSAKHEAALSNHYHRLLQASSSCKEADKMVKISLQENVMKSASSVYFEANKMHWIVDKVPDQSLLNTAGWRFIIPQLYKMYPNHDMNLNLSVSSPPILNVEKQQIKAKIPLDVVIDVLDVEEVIPVACISTVISASVSPGISGNALTGYVKLNDITMSLKWSKIGDLHMNLVQMLMSTTLRTVVLPYVNLKLSKGFQIPVFHGYGLQDAHILCTDSWIVICSDVAPVKQFNLI
ncbi:UNVERIFIED_CONTAM: putative BPI/LBP family protein [Sesamum calycinum]|uniref:BPI/LBP family protein n=1 Tax=Sesamum calycinum TaxID=2727403 RepID=A0AAW2MAP8_9LAMI